MTSIECWLWPRRQGFCFIREWWRGRWRGVAPSRNGELRIEQLGGEYCNHAVIIDLRWIVPLGCDRVAQAGECPGIDAPRRTEGGVANRN